MNSEINEGKNYIVSGATLKKWRAELDALRSGGNVAAGAGTRIRRGPGGAVVEATRTRRGGAREAAHPFRVTVRRDPNNSSQWQARVEPGTLMRSFRFSDAATIAGLDSWFNVSADDIVYLRGAVSFYSLTSATVTTAGQERLDLSANPWEEDSILEDDGNNENPIQTLFRLPLAVIEDGGVTQLVFSHLQLFVFPVLLRPALYPRPGFRAV